MQRRNKGEGSISERADGRFMARITRGRNPVTGKPQTEYIYGATRAAVAKQLRTIAGRLEDGQVMPGRSPNMATWLRTWVDTYDKIGQSSRRIYAGAIETHLVPAFGHLRVSQITAPVVQKWILAHKAADEADGAEGTRRRVKLALTVLSGALKAARAQQFTAINAATIILAPKYRESREVVPYTPDEARRLIAACATHPYGAAVIVLLASGLREGEALGLGWDNVDFDHGRIKIREQLVRVHDHKKIRPSFRALRKLKTKKSRRTLTLPAACLTVLREHRRAQLEARLKAGERWVETGRVFVVRGQAGNTRPGGYLGHGNFRGIFYRLLEAAKLRPIHVHDLRHSNASLLLAFGRTDLREVGLLLGHANLATTQDIYSHLVDEVSARAAEQLEALFSGSEALFSGSDSVSDSVSNRR